jgi:hypothetical protein
MSERVKMNVITAILVIALIACASGMVIVGNALMEMGQ